MAKQITLTQVTGVARRSGTDPSGNVWIEFAVDSFADELPGECCLCHRLLWSGWQCLDGGDEVCDRHVTVKQ